MDTATNGAESIFFRLAWGSRFWKENGRSMMRASSEAWCSEARALFVAQTSVCGISFGRQGQNPQAEACATQTATREGLAFKEQRNERKCKTCGEPAAR